MTTVPSRQSKVPTVISIGTLRCIAVNVTDFEVGYRFWSAVTGWELLGPPQGLQGWRGYLGTRNPSNRVVDAAVATT